MINVSRGFPANTKPSLTQYSTNLVVHSAHEQKYYRDFEFRLLDLGYSLLPNFIDKLPCSNDHTISFHLLRPLSVRIMTEARRKKTTSTKSRKDPANDKREMSKERKPKTHNTPYSTHDFTVPLI